MSQPVFPDFNVYSMPLIILVGQGYLFAVLLFVRFYKKRKSSDLILALFLVITGLRCTSYIIGFMSWYDTFPNTKINYFLPDFSLILGPLVYFYVKSITIQTFSFSKKDLWHFAPWGVYIALQVFVYVYDSQQPNFDDVQNGVLHVKINFGIATYMVVIGIVSRMIYFFLAAKIFVEFKAKLLQFFSNTYKVELNWLRNFLIAYLTLFVLRILFITFDFTIDLSWTQNWWWYLFASMVLVYLGLMGVFADLGKLTELKFIERSHEIKDQKNEVDETVKVKLTEYMNTEKVYLQPDLTLAELSKQLSIPVNQLSKVINTGFDKNFNDFVNEFRIEEVKKALLDPSNQQYSILGIAFNCGFNSKATFNRVFKKVTGSSPSEFQSKSESN